VKTGRRAGGGQACGLASNFNKDSDKQTRGMQSSHRIPHVARLAERLATGFSD
jgi:hypothetical protein